MAEFGLQMPQMPDFTFQAPDVGGMALDGFYAAQDNVRANQNAGLLQNADRRQDVRLGMDQQDAAMRQTQFTQEQQDRVAMITRAKEAQAAFAEFYDKIDDGTASAADIAQLTAAYPELSESVKQTMDGLAQEQKATYSGLIFQSASALKLGKPEMAAKLFEDYAAAAENSGQTDVAALSRAMAETARQDPAAALGTLGVFAQSLDPEINTAVFGEGGGNPSDRFKVVGSQLVDLNADGGPQAVLTAPGQTETVYGPDGQPILTRGPSPSDLRLTEAQGKATGFVYRMEESDKTLTELEQQGTSLWNKAADKAPIVGNYMRSDEAQKFDQAKRDFLNAILRQESGAVISPEEFANGDKQYFPQPGDGQAVIEQKRRNREVAIAGVRASSGKGGETSPPAAGSPDSQPSTAAVPAQSRADELLKKHGGSP
jgi:hypothetical protein